jgi:hypothetical protein
MGCPAGLQQGGRNRRSHVLFRLRNRNAEPAVPGTVGGTAKHVVPSYRRDGSTRMRVFKTKDLALRAASEMIGDRDDDGLEVGPMLAPRDGNVFKGDELRRMCDSDTV